jgi:frataxin-like iron-binding protein CyaY
MRSKFKDKVVAVETLNGEKLIGYIVNPPEEKVVSNLKVAAKRVGVKYERKEGLWLHRRTHLTFLSHSEVKSIRLAEYLEEESLIG